MRESQVAGCTEWAAAHHVVFWIQRQASYEARIRDIIIIKHVLIKVTLSCQRHCRGTAQSLTRKKEQAEALTLVAV